MKIVITTQNDSAVQVGVILADKSVHANQVFDSSYNKTNQTNDYNRLSSEDRSKIKQDGVDKGWTS